MDHPDAQDQATLQVDAPPTAVTDSPQAARVRPRYLFSGVASIAVLLMLVLLARSLAAYHVAPLGVVPQPTSTATYAPQATIAAQTGIYGQYTLMSVAMVSAKNVWAVGADDNQSSQSGHRSVFMHFDGLSWKRVPTTFDYPMVSICMLPSGEGWAIGGNAILHYSSGQWAVDLLDHAGQNEMLKAITMVSPDEGWAVGSTGEGQAVASIMLHYTHGHWTHTVIPQVSSMNVLRAISMSSADDGWAVGSDYVGGEKGMALHYSQGEWKRVDVGVPSPLNGISALSPDDVWAVGASNPAIGVGIILHLSQGVWRVVPSPTSNILHAITMRSPSEGWISGDGAAVLHYDGVKWTQVSPIIHHVGLLSISVTGGEGWATGWTGSASVLLRLHNGVWTQFVFPAATT